MCDERKIFISLLEYPCRRQDHCFPLYPPLASSILVSEVTKMNDVYPLRYQSPTEKRGGGRNHVMIEYAYIRIRVICVII
jgi:hypothetical protein